MNTILRSAVASALLAAPLLAGAAGSELVTSGLNNPRGLAFAPNGELYVAEAGNGGPNLPGTPCALAAPQFLHFACYGTTGALTRIVPGQAPRRLVAGLPSAGIVTGPSTGQAEAGPTDVSFQGMVGFVTIGGAGTPETRATFASRTTLFGQVLRVLPNGRWSAIADVAAKEFADNPAGGARDSNPYGVLALPGRLIVADAAANALFERRANGALSTFSVPNALPFPPYLPPPLRLPREAVPTSVAEGPDGHVYVGLLGQAPFWRGWSAILKVPSDGGPGTVAVDGVTAVIDVAFDAGGALYWLEVGAGANAFPPAGPPFLPGQGRLLRRCPGNATNEVLEGGLTFPAGVAIGPDGAAWFTNRGISAFAGEVRRLPLTPCA